MKTNYTRKMIMDGLLNLLAKKYYLDITVSDLVRVSNVSRASFYRNYKCIDDVLDEMLNALKYEVTNRLYPVLISNDKNQLHLIIKEFFTMIKNSNLSFPIILPENRHIITNKFDKDFRNCIKENHLTFNDKYKIPLNSSIIFTICKIWGSSGYIEDIDEITNFVVSSLC